jgi:hypothetical protein
MDGAYSMHEETFIQGLDERALGSRAIVKTGRWENEFDKYVKGIRWEVVGWTVSVLCEHNKNITTGLINLQADLLD